MPLLFWGSLSLSSSQLVLFVFLSLFCQFDDLDLSFLTNLYCMLSQLTDFGLSKVGLINSTDDLSGQSVGSSDFLGHEKRDSATKFPSRPEQRQKHSVVGTPDYLAPEILLGMGHG